MDNFAQLCSSHKVHDLSLHKLYPIVISSIRLFVVKLSESITRVALHPALRRSVNSVFFLIRVFPGTSYSPASIHSTPQLGPYLLKIILLYFSINICFTFENLVQPMPLLYVIYIILQISISIFSFSVTS